MPVKDITISYLSAVSITISSLTLPPGSAIYFTPLFFALSMLSSNGKNASLPSVTPSILERYAFFYSRVNSSRRTEKYFCHFPSAKTSSQSSER